MTSPPSDAEAAAPDVVQAAGACAQQATRAFYVDTMRALDRAGIRYVVGGGYAMVHYTGVPRTTKDLDLFIRPEDRDRTLTTLTAAGYRTEFFYPFWIAKALSGEDFVDIIYNSGNGLCPVDDQWLDCAHDAEVLGYATRMSPAEEQLWSKAFVQDRDRYDGADVAHLILRAGRQFDWERLIRRFRGHEPVLLAHLILFDYIYPTEGAIVPEWVKRALERSTPAAPSAKVCRGPNLAQRGYGMDLLDWGYLDGRLKPYGLLSEDEIRQLPEPERR